MSNPLTVKYSNPHVYKPSLQYVQKEYPLRTIIYYSNYHGCSRKAVVIGYQLLKGWWSLKCLTEGQQEKTISLLWVIKKET